LSLNQDANKGKVRGRNQKVVQVPKIPQVLKNADFYSFFNMLNDVKREFLFGPEEQDLESESATYKMQLGLSSGHANVNANANARNQVQRAIDDSASSCYGSATDTEDSDSGTSPSNRPALYNETAVNRVASELKKHLRGIHDLLDQLALSADFISNRYLDEVEGQSAVSDKEQFMF
jgi:hypothetical protein